MDISSTQWRALIADGALTLGIGLSAETTELFALHARELLYWNRRINLTRITDPAEMAVKHYLDSILPAPWIPPASRLLDVGSGGGFPGIPLKILLPTLSVTLIDAVRKKVSFLNHAIRTLALQQIQAHHVRLEDIKAQAPFDVIVSRAFSSLEAFVPASLSLLSEGGRIIAFKGLYREAVSEWEQLESAGTAWGDMDLAVEMKRFILPPEGEERTLVLIKPKIYPIL